MDELVALVFEAIDGFFRRAANARAQASRFARAALAERPRSAVTRPDSASSAAAPTASGAARPAVTPDFAARAPSAAAATRAEANLVRGLFANPQSLAAAFIAAEILAQPVALRER